MRGSSLLARSLTNDRTSQGRFPGSRVLASLPTFPGFPSGGALRAPEGSGLAGYSGATAQVFDLLPYYPPATGGTLTLRAGV